MINPDIEAENLVTDFNIEIPIDPKIICSLISSEQLKIEYEEQAFESGDLCGMSMRHNKKIKIIVNSQVKHPARRLFTAAHELGHVILHLQTDRTLSCNNSDIYNFSERNIEYEANRFASSLIMPRNLIRNRIGNNDITWRLIKDLANFFRSSLEATARRVVYLSDSAYALIIHDKDRMQSPIKSKKFPINIPITLFPKYLEKDIYHKEELLPDSLLECNLADWGIVSNRYICYYSSLFFADYRRIMSLILLEEIDIDESEEEWEKPHF